MTRALRARPQGVTGDDLYLSSNEWGVPDLLPEMAATMADVEWFKWGSLGRTSRISGGYHFYCDDYKFATVWDKPALLPASGAYLAVEVNYSTTDAMPAAVALWNVYRKRWLARHWQGSPRSHGVLTFVDLNVAAKHKRLNLLGVPEGWKAYATRTHRDVGLYGIEQDAALAAEHAGTDDILFLVFGGRTTAGELCERRGWWWVPDQSLLRREVALG